MIGATIGNNLHPHMSQRKRLQVIYVGRNPKDACVSWYHHMTMDGFNGDFKDFAKLFKENKTLYNPLVPHIIEGQ